MFEKTTTRLTALYLGIIMAISIFFSLNLYNILVSELSRDFRRQGVVIDRLPDSILPFDSRDEFTNNRLIALQEAKSHVLGRLILTNVIILVGGGLLSHYLARRTLKPIEESHEALERFTADASHELRTPIAAMQSEIEVSLMNPKLTLKEAKEQLQSNLEELARLTSLSEGLLRLARLENHTIDAKISSLKSVINKSVQQVEATTKAKKISLDTKIASDIKANVDSEGLSEALTIILDNAVKYSPEKSDVIVELIKENKTAVINIIDKGIGIQAHDIARIFERFYRADSARSKHEYNGYGLGLSIAKDIVDLHGGEIKVSSKPDEGSTFSVRLPM